MKKWIERFIQKVAEANKKSFGTQRMNCCDLNKKNEVSKKVDKK